MIWVKASIWKVNVIFKRVKKISNELFNQEDIWYIHCAEYQLKINLN